MFTSSEFDRINSEFNERQNARRGKLKKIWGVLLGLTIFLILLFIYLFPNQFKNEDTVWIMPVYGGMAFAITFIGYLLTIRYISEKPFFEYVYPEIYQKLNMTEGLFFEYHAYEKQNKEFNTKGGLFTRIATVRSRRHVKGVTEDQIQFDIYDCTMTTSSGNSQQTHFDGTYIRIQKQLNTMVQVRSNGSPKLKGVKFAALRYFNAAGYDVTGEVKGLESGPANLLPVVMEAAAGMREKLMVFGDDYDTVDGTGVRDYIHVSDLARAHVMSLKYLHENQVYLLLPLFLHSPNGGIDVISAPFVTK